MDIRLIAEDKKAGRLGSKIVSEIAREQAASVLESFSEHLEQEADVCGWDCDSSRFVPHDFGQATLLLVLTQAADVAAARGSFGPDATLILKPLAPAIVSEAPSLAISIWAAKLNRSARPIRGDSPDQDDQDWIESAAVHDCYVPVRRSWSTGTYSRNVRGSLVDRSLLASGKLTDCA